jgi:hypothetical protein
LVPRTVFSIGKVVEPRWYARTFAFQPPVSSDVMSGYGTSVYEPPHFNKLIRAGFEEAGWITPTGFKKWPPPR